MMAPQQLLSFLEDHSRWIRLRALGNSGLVRSSVLMPAFGYILLLNDSVQTYLTIKYDGWLLNYLPATWRIWLLFYGSFALAIASLLFAWRCPQEIKRYESSFVMADAETEHQSRLGQLEACQAKLIALYAGLSKWEGDLHGRTRPETLDRASHSFADKSHDIAIWMVHQWQIRNIQQPHLRMFILCLFWIGFILLAIPAVWTLILVTIVAARRLIG